LVLMATLLARGTVADVNEQLGEELVTLLAPVGGQLGPDSVAGRGHEGLRRWEWRKTLVHHVLLLVVIHKA
jgi:hypothetical protein